MGTKIAEWTLLLRTNRFPSPLSTCKSDADVNPIAPICIGMDYNANINWIVAGLPDGRKLNVINSFYVKFECHSRLDSGGSVYRQPDAPR